MFSDEPEVYLPEYSQPAILHAAYFHRVVKLVYYLQQCIKMRTSAPTIVVLKGSANECSLLGEHQNALAAPHNIGFEMENQLKVFSTSLENA